MACSRLADGDKYRLHKADHRLTPPALKRHNLLVVSLANNHALDFGSQGLTETIETLTKYSIACFGAGKNDAESSAPYTLNISSDKREFRIAVIGALDYDAKYDSVYLFYSSVSKLGVNKLTVENISDQIRNIRKRYSSVFIVAYPHWFENYVWRSEKQSRLAHTIIDAGADMVIGHGAHMFQEIEMYNGRWIIYS